MRLFWSFWKKLAKLRLGWRFAIKMAVFGCVVFFVLYPNPVLFVRQINHFLHIESLIQTDFKGIEVINRDIDAALPPDITPEQEINMVQHYVYRHIRYEHDWKNWLNIDFWPTAGQVWDRKQEDCDGRAILAVSILRSRGFETAKLVGNIRHIWVDVDRQEIMGPDQEQNIISEEGKTVIALPSFEMWLNSAALYIADFPALRNLILFFTLLLLCYHPCTNLTSFLGMTTLGLVGFVLLKDWALDIRDTDVVAVNVHFVMSCGLIGSALGLSLLMDKLIKHYRLRRNIRYG